MDRLLDPGLILTGIAVLVAFGWGRGTWLRNLLLMSWAATVAGVAMGADMPAIVFTAAMMDFIVAGTSAIIVMNDHSRDDARTVGVISIALMPAHLCVSIYEGLTYEGWVLYAGACNAAFVAQCLIVRGWLDGLGRAIARFFGRLRRLPFVRVRRP